MPKQNNYVTQDHFDETFKGVDSKFTLIMEKLDWLIGKYSAHDEEHVLLNNKVSEHSDNLELVNTKLGIQL